MIRLNPASSSNGAAKRRQRQQQQQRNDNNNNTNNNNNNNADNDDAITHDDMYNDEATNNGTSSKVNRLFEELLGDNASAIGSAANGGTKGGEESTAMSSVLGPILGNNNNNNGNGNNKNDLGHIPEERKASREYVLNINSNNNPTLGRMKQHQQQQQQQRAKKSPPQTQQRHRPQRKPQQMVDEMTTTDEDTYMTKPREIAYDPNDDDVSALFGGHGGASMSGVESYMGTFAALRKNRSKGREAQQQQQSNGGGGGMGMGMGMSGMFGGKGRNNSRRQQQQQYQHQEEDSRRTGGTSTFQSHGVNSILEEIGLRPQGKRKESFSEDEEEEMDESNKGHLSSNGRRSRSERSGRRSRGTHRTNNNGGENETAEYHPSESTWERIKSTKPKTWAVILVGIMFIAIQFTTVQKRDKKTMDYLHWSRFRDHKYATARDANAYSSTTDGGSSGAGIRDPEMNGSGRRRGASFGNTAGGDHVVNSLNKDGIGDVLRKTVPLMQQKDWEQDQIMFDDGIDGLDGGNPNLRGGGNGNNNAKNVAKESKGFAQQKKQELEVLQKEERQMQELDKLREQVKQQQQQNERQKQEQNERQKQQQQQQQGNKMMGNSNNGKQPPQGNRMMMADDTNNNAKRQDMENLGDTHPLLKPKTGLSMEDALVKLNGGSDKLSDIDPVRPQQGLSNDLLPKRFNVFAELKTPYIVGRDTPYFWHIPRSGGVVIKTMLSHCLGQTLAAEVGEMGGHHNDTELKVVSFSEHNYTNVNIATPDGITRALNMGLVPGHLSNTLVSAHVDLVPSLFNANDRARGFVLFRHPVDRAASMFYFLQGTGYPPLKNMTVDDYAKSELIENNWLVRILSESMTGPIDMDNLEIAKEVLRRKFIVGLLDNKRGSFARFDHYFKWKDSPNYEKEFGCRKQLMDEKYTPKHPIRKDSDTWKLLLEQNRYDVHLYDFAKELFSQQSYIFGL